MVDFKACYDGGYITFLGAGGEHEDWVNGLNKMWANADIGQITDDDCVWLTGEEMNSHYDLTGNNAYPEDLTILAVKLDKLHTDKLAIWRLNYRDMLDARWFNDIVDNNSRREGRA